MEWWTRCAFLVAGSLLVGMVYMSMRQGGSGPIWFFRSGRILWVLAALGLMLYGVGASALRRPFLQRRRAHALVALALTIGIGSHPLPYPSSREDVSSAVAFRLPVEGEWRVRWGGETRDENLLSILHPDQRWGMHLVKEGEPSPESARSPGWGEAIVAPAAGRVVRVVDEWPDTQFVGGLEAAPEGVPVHGNLIVLEVARGEYLFLTHLMHHSARVVEGQHVESGAPLALVGFSGRFGATRRPHVALHLQTTPVPGWGEAIPWRFHDYEADGRPVERGIPRGGAAGQRVRHLGTDVSERQR